MEKLTRQLQLSPCASNGTLNQNYSLSLHGVRLQSLFIEHFAIGEKQLKNNRYSFKHISFIKRSSKIKEKHFQKVLLNNMSPKNVRRDGRTVRTNLIAIKQREKNILISFLLCIST